MVLLPGFLAVKGLVMLHGKLMSRHTIDLQGVLCFVVEALVWTDFRSNREEVRDMSFLFEA